MGTVGCFGQIENIKRQSLSKSPQVLYLTLKSFHDIMRIFVYNGLLAIHVDRKIQ